MTQNTNRYARQIVLDEIGEIGQQKLANASVLCVGAGGLGSPALLYLASAGIGHIGIIDGDTVDESNLQRQVLFQTQHVDTSKAKTAQQQLYALNPHINITIYDEPLTDKNLDIIFPNYDIIIDGTDNFSSKFLINDGTVKHQKPLVYGAIQGFEGQVSVFDATQGPCYRCLYPAPPTAHVKNCAEAGVIGAVAGIIGITQALQVIQILVGDTSFAPLVGKLWLLDTKTMKNRILHIPKNPECSVCSQDTDTIILEYHAPTCGIVKTVSPHFVHTHPESIVLDVRELEEWNAGHIDHAIHYPLSNLIQGNMPPISHSKNIIVYCQKQPRSEQAMDILQNHGYKNISLLEGGFEAWKKL